MPLVDLSHTIHDGLTTYPGPPAPAIRDFVTREASRGHHADGTSFHIVAAHHQVMFAEADPSPVDDALRAFADTEVA